MEQETAEAPIQTEVRPHGEVFAVTGPRRRKDSPDAVRSRQRRFRARVLKELWVGRVATCLGPAACPWRDDARPCTCAEGLPCGCERRYLETILDLCEREIGRGAGGLMATACLDVARAIRLGREAEVRNARLKLLELVLRYQGHARTLALQEARLERSKPSDDGDFLSTLLGAPVGAPSRPAPPCGTNGHIPAPDPARANVDAPVADHDDPSPTIGPPGTIAPPGGPPTLPAGGES